MEKIRIQEISLSYGDYCVFDKLSENIFTGEVYVFVGESGCGKTTLLKILSGLMYPDSGTVEWDGKVIQHFGKREMLDYHQSAGFVFQNAALVGNMSIYENLALYYRFHTDMKEDEIRKVVQDYVDTFHFTDDLKNRPASLSTGEKMLVSIMRAISHDPDVIFWDEPVANLDQASTRRVKEVIRRLKKEKRTQVIGTFDANFAFSVADRVGVIDECRVIESGGKMELLNSENSRVREILNLGN